MQTLAPLLRLARCLWSSQHQNGEQRELGRRDADHLIEQVPVLRRAASDAARQPRPAFPREPLESRADGLLVVVDHRIAVRSLVAREPERVQGEWVGVRRRPLLLDQAPQKPDLDGICVHLDGNATLDP